MVLESVDIDRCGSTRQTSQNTVPSDLLESTDQRAQDCVQDVSAEHDTLSTPRSLDVASIGLQEICRLRYSSGV